MGIPAFKEALGNSGHSAEHPCSICQNVKLERYFKAKHRPWCVSTVEFDATKWIPHTDSTIKLLLTRLGEAQAILSKEQYKEREKCVGWHYNINSLCLAPWFNSAGIMFDWMHVWLEGGLLDRELGLLMKHLGNTKTCSYLELGDYVEKWVWSKNLGSTARLAKLFTKQSAVVNLKNSEFSCTCSEMLNLIPVLQRYFLKLKDAGRNNKQ